LALSKKNPVMGRAGRTPFSLSAKSPLFITALARAPYHQHVAKWRSRELIQKTAALASIPLAVRMPLQTPFSLCQF